MSTIYCDTKPSEVHDEDQELIAQLARLQNLYSQLFELRTLLPERVISPIKQAIATQNGSRQSLTPASLAAQLRKVAVQGSEEVRTFQSAWYSDELGSIRERASSTEYPPGDDAWRTDYENLANSLMFAAPKEASATTKAQPSADEDQPEDTAKVIKDFQTAHPHLKLHVAGERSDLVIDVKVSGIPFQITKVEGDDKGYIVRRNENGKKSSFANQVLEYLKIRKLEPKLSTLLSLLASYHDATTRPCDKCGQVFDDNLEQAVVRLPADETDSNHIKWKALHQKCS